MAKPWKEVQQSESYLSLSDEDKASAQNAYFNEVVAPQAGEKIQEARHEFFSQYPVQTTTNKKLPDLNLASKSRKWQDTYHIAENLGIPTEMVDLETGAKFLDRLDYSMGDTDEEVSNKFLTKYPDGVMMRVSTGPEPKLVDPERAYPLKDYEPSRLMYKENAADETERWKSVEDYGLSVADIADLGGASIPVAASIGLGLATGGTSVGAQMIAYGGGYAAGYTGKEAIEEARGQQLEPFKETAKRGAVETGLTALGAGGGALAMKPVNVMAGRGLLKTDRTTQQFMKSLQRAKEAGLEVEELTVGQQLPTHMAIQRLEAQAHSTSTMAQGKLINQKISAGEALQAVTNLSEYKAGKILQKESQRVYNKELNQLRNQIGRPSPRKATKAAIEGMQAWQKNYKNDINMGYRSLDSVAKAEQPIFDLANPVQGNSVIGQAMVIKNNVLASTETGLVNVSEAPSGALAGIIDDILKLQNVQVDYTVLKALRSRTGKLIEDWPWEADVNKGQAKQLYKALTLNIESPINKAMGFAKEHSKVSTKARAYYEALDSQSIRRFLQTENTGSLVKQFSKPLSMTDEVIHQIKSPYFPKDKAKIFKDGLKQEWLLNEDAVKNLARFKMTDETAWRAMVSKSEEKQLFKLAMDIDDLNISPIGRVVRENIQTKGAVNELLLKDVTRADLQFLTQNFSPRGKEAARAAIYEDIMDKSSTMVKGVPTLDKKALGETISKYQKSGLWDSPILTKNDRIKIKGLDAYMNLIMYRGKDPGVSLEAAQAFTDLKHPVTFFNGVHKLTVNSLMAKFLSSKTADKIMLGSGKEKFKADPLIATGIIINGLFEGTELGEKGKKVQ